MFSGGKDSIFVSNLIFQATRFLPFSFEKSRGSKIKILFKVETIYDCLSFAKSCLFWKSYLSLLLGVLCLSYDIGFAITNFHECLVMNYIDDLLSFLQGLCVTSSSRHLPWSKRLKLKQCLTKHHMIGRTDWHCLVKRNACLRCRNVNSGDGN